MKLYWKLYLEWFSNDKILSDFLNPIHNYGLHVSGKIIDIGCGQSEYLLDLLDTDFELFAVDTEESQLEFLKQRVISAGYSEKRLIYSSKEFPSDDFKDFSFSCIIVSNLLHFFSKEQAFKFIAGLSNYSSSGCLIIITVHSQDHLSNKKETNSESYFKSFYSKKDLHEMFPISQFEYLSFIEKEKEPSNYQIKFLKHWINENYKDKCTLDQIKKIQNNYQQTCCTNSIDFVIRKR
jgi:cyclopropane fatty-acyl-phospholipid synthase-like methyltransferase